MGSVHIYVRGVTLLCIVFNFIAKEFMFNDVTAN